MGVGEVLEFADNHRCKGGAEMDVGKNGMLSVEDLPGLLR